MAPAKTSSPSGSAHSFESSSSSIDEAGSPASIHAGQSYTLAQHLSTLRCLQDGNFTNIDTAIRALPRRHNKSQRPIALQLATEIYPELSEIAAIIKYEQLIKPAKAIVRQRERDRSLAQLQPTNNIGGKLMKIQGPWAGQELDPVDLRGPVALPMPVKIGETKDFAPIFTFMAQDRPFNNGKSQDVDSLNHDGKYGVESSHNTPILEFERGIIYEDGRLDLCKQVVGPTHIGKLMESLEPNHHIRHFLLGNNAISTTGAKSIADFLRKFPDRMETWYLAGCHITRQGLSILVPQMIKSSTINNLWFKRNPFGPNSSSLLAELVLRTSKLRTLDLETCELGDEGTSRFIDAICGKQAALRHLYLNANGIGQKACASLGKYLLDPNCALESLFLSTNPIGDAGITALASGFAANKSLKRITLASAGLTSKGVTELCVALTEGDHPLEALDLSASLTAMVHGQKFNYLDDTCIDALKSLIMSPNMRSLELGRTAFSAAGLQAIRSVAGSSELVHFDVHRVKLGGVSSDGPTKVFDTEPIHKSCSLEVRTQLLKNQAKYFPHSSNDEDFKGSEEFRYVRNTSDVRQIDSMYRTRARSSYITEDAVWEEVTPFGS